MYAKESRETFRQIEDHFIDLAAHDATSQWLSASREADDQHSKTGVLESLLPAHILKTCYF